jgi:hypothetical protein
VKRSIADGSVGSPHVRVGHRQALILNASVDSSTEAFIYIICKIRIINYLAKYI